MDAETTPAHPPVGTGEPAAGTELRTTTGKVWRLKTLGFAIALGLLGLWGWYDAYHVYPARGLLHEQFMRRNYLTEADAAFQFTTASVEDPAAEFRRLNSIPENELSRLDQARLAWLRSISRLENLSDLTAENQAELARRAEDPSKRLPTRTLFADPRAELGHLTQALASAEQPKPLAAYDLPVQFLFMYGGALGCIYLLGLFFSVRSRVYRYDPAAHRLTLPSGRSLVPADIALVDKRQWDKYIVYLKPADGSAEIKLDLYRHRPLEDWILEMEKLTPGYVPPEPEPQPAEAAASQG